MESNLPNKNFDITEYITCGICFEEYDNLKSQPIILNCGHTICKTCLFGILNTHSNKKCPFDKGNLFSNNINEYKINTPILEIVLEYKKSLNIFSKFKNIISFKTEEGKYKGEYKGKKIDKIKEGFGLMEYNNGDIYQGYFKNNKREGKGIYKYNNNDIYEGNWENNLQNGKGKFTYNSGDILSYEGNFRNGNYFGFGKITYINKVELETIFLNNNEYIDIMKIKNFEGNTFIGHINKENNSVIGKGYEISKENNISIGNFIYDNDTNTYIKNGENFIILYSNNKKYIGPIMMDVIIGKGEIIYKNGNKYKGDILNGEKHGKGFMKFNDGSEFEGEYKNDKRNGNGIFTKGNYYYNGNWVNNVKEGNGYEVYENGESYSGDFKNGFKHGKGVYKFNNHKIYKGEWKNDKMNGKGVIINENGTEIKGYFKDGILDNKRDNCFIF